MDALTGGAFSAATPSERAARIRDWLAGQPSDEQLQEVFKELSIKDKGAARAVRERINDIRRTKDQEVIAVEWAQKAQQMLTDKAFNVADAIAWQREAAKAGAPLSREPLSVLKAQLFDRVKIIEDLQHRVQVQREAAVLLAQRIEVLSTKPWVDAVSAVDSLRSDVGHWQTQALDLTGDQSWASVDSRFPPLLDSSRAQLLLVWDAFQSALAATQLAAQDAAAPLPSVLLWADEIRVARGLPSELKIVEPIKTSVKISGKSDNAQRQQTASQAVAAALESLALASEQLKSDALAHLRSTLRQQGRWLSDEMTLQVHEKMLEAGDAQGWQPQSVDRQREGLIARAESLANNQSDGQALGGRKLQESLRSLREQWKQVDQGSAPNHVLWKRFDEACNTAYKQVEAWLERVRAESGQHKAARLALIEEVKAWTVAQANNQDWKNMARSLRQFAERWRDSGHVGEKVFTELQSQWKQVMSSADAPLQAAQKLSVERRHAMIAEAQSLADAPALRVDAVKELQQRWQAEAQSVPLDRKFEQKLWDTFRKPLDEAFNRKGADRTRQVSLEDLPARDRAVLEAAKGLQAANASGDVQKIRDAMNALEDAVRSHPIEPGKEAAASHSPVLSATTASLVAVRGDDRPSAKKESAATGDRDVRANARKDPRPQRFEKAPRLGDLAFRAQREALDNAQFALRKLATQAHGEALSQLMEAWAKRDGQLMPSAAELGSKATSQARGAWLQALATAPSSESAEGLLRLEIAADVSTPAEHLAARRMLQLQMLTRRNMPSPEQTWVQDVATVLGTDYSEESAKRLKSVLKLLLRK